MRQTRTSTTFGRRQKAAEDFVKGAYPALVENRLEGKRIAVLVLGSVDPTVGFVERALDDSGARLARMRSLTLPLRLENVEAASEREARVQRLCRRQATREPRA